MGDRSRSVVVQGPPGTGKTHTISNLIGHLLSQGKSILVTTHTTKALRVLRDKVPDMLKPLCASVLGSDQLARRQLESAVSSTTERLALVLANLLSEFDDELLAQRWRPYAIVTGLHGAVERQVWASLIEKIESAVQSNAKYSLLSSKP